MQCEGIEMNKFYNISKMCGSISIILSITGAMISKASIFYAEAIAILAVLFAASAIIFYSFGKIRRWHIKKHKKIIKIARKPDVEILFIKRIEDV